MNILGISSFYHDAAAAIVIDGSILAAAQEERFSRVKHDPSFPKNAVQFCLDETCLSPEEIDAVVFYDKPFLKIERLLESYVDAFPSGFLSFLKAIPVAFKEKLFIKKLIRDELKGLGFAPGTLKLLFSGHHLSHAASAYYPSPFSEAAILTVDGVGEWATATISHGRDSAITRIKELIFPDSVGLLYSAFTWFLGFKVNSAEYKLMGLAAYGNHGSAETTSFEKIIREKLATVYEDGSIKIHQQYFNYVSGLTMAKEKQWEKLFGFKKRRPEEPIGAHHCNLALAIQNITEEIVLKMAMTAAILTGSKNLCLAGGVALNCVANGKIIEKNIFENIYIQPAAGDAGGALGAALAVNYLHFNEPRKILTPDAMSGSLLGPEYSDEAIQIAAKKFRAHYTVINDEKTLADEVAGLLNQQQVVGWLQGRMEFGPRALGSRSILADPRSEKMQQVVNEKIKFREGFRPFAPIVQEGDASMYFDIACPSPYMLFVRPLKERYRLDLPPAFESFSLPEKLAVKKSGLPAVTHTDFSARIQTVERSVNPLIWELLESFKKITGCGVLLNTSFNVRGEPLVCTPADALSCFFNTGMDVLVMGRQIFFKKEQPDTGRKTLLPFALNDD